jgi:hypothetical protein
MLSDRQNPMPPNRSLVRASDIGVWTDCHRAWWLARVRQIPHRDPARLAYGQQHHEAHGRRLQLAHRLHKTGLALAGLALLLAILAGAVWLLG